MFPLPKPLKSVMRTPQATRRDFLLGAAAVAGGFAIGFRPSLAQAQDARTVNPFDAYIAVHENGRVTVLSSQFDMGQGIYHGIATLVVEELGASFDQIDVTGAYGNPELYGNLAFGGAFQGTGGSSSVFTSWERYRTAAAAAREMLKLAGAGQ